MADGSTFRFDVSTAANGLGCKSGSYCTPFGVHRVKLMIGVGCPDSSVFIKRRLSSEQFSQQIALLSPCRDWILARILWLEGMERGINRGGYTDTLRRFIYIHGTADEQLIGTPASHGCIRMRRKDIVDLFSKVDVGTIVDIR